MTTDLFAPYRLGALELANRFVMAPMTRNRAAAGGVPTSLNVGAAAAGACWVLGRRPS